RGSGSGPPWRTAPGGEGRNALRERRLEYHPARAAVNRKLASAGPADRFGAQLDEDGPGRVARRFHDDLAPDVRREGRSVGAPREVGDGGGLALVFGMALLVEERRSTLVGSVAVHDPVVGAPRRDPHVRHPRDVAPVGGVVGVLVVALVGQPG